MNSVFKVKELIHNLKFQKGILKCQPELAVSIVMYAN